MKYDRLIGVDWLRGFAAFGIVGCHLSLPNMTAEAGHLKALMDVNVGVFAMLAGFFFLPSCSKFVSWLEYVKQRSKRLLIPYLFWSFAYMVVDLIMDLLMHKPELSFEPDSWKYWYSILLQGDASAHLWFLIALFYTQVAGFLVSKGLLKHKSLGNTVICGVSGFVMVVLCGEFGNWYRFYFLRLVGFFWMGVALFFVKDFIRRVPIVVWIVLDLIGATLLSMGWRCGKVGDCVLILPLVCAALAWHPQSEKLEQMGRFLGRTSFGVYLIHLFFTIALREIIVRIASTQDVFIFLGDQVVAWILSLVVVASGLLIAKQFPVLKYLFP